MTTQEYKPHVTVVIPTYNVQGYIAETFQSVVQQSYRPLSVVVGDDGSTDGTLKELSRIGAAAELPLEVLALRHTGNPALARNSALERVSGDCIAYLDSDDVCEPNRIEESVAALSLAGNEASFVFSDYLIIDGGGQLIQGQTLASYSRLTKLPRKQISEYAYLLSGEHVHDALLGGSFIRPSQVLMRTDLIRSSRGFDESLENAHDLDLFLELARMTDVVWLDKPLVRYRYRPGNMTSRGLVRMAPSRISVIKRHRERAYTSEGRRAADERIADTLASLAYTYRSSGNYREAIRAQFQECAAKPSARAIKGIGKSLVRIAMEPMGLSWWSRHLFHPLWDAKDRSSRLRILKLLEKSQWNEISTMRLAQQVRLRQACVHAARNVPYYRAAFEAAALDPESVTTETLGRLPVLTKSKIRELGHELIADGYQIENLCFHKTGGSTGIALKTFFEESWRERRNADALRANQWAGWFHGMKAAAIWGNPPQAITWKQKLRSKLYDRTIYLDTMRIDDASLSDFVKCWQCEKPRVVFGHSHSLFIVAKYLIENGIRSCRPVGIVSTSMMLLPQERCVIEEAFDCRVTDRYGCEEVSLIASECERHWGFHLNIEHLVVEFLDEHGVPVQAGQEGRIVVTDLFNRAMPLIRYEVGDVGVPSSRVCKCGRGMPLMEKVIGRVADYLKRRDGSLVAGVSLVERTLTRVVGIEQMQIVQGEIGRLTVNYVRGSDFAETTLHDLAIELEGGFEESLDITFVEMIRIPQELSGKYRFSICTI